ncbi:MAG: hypothetical protein ACYTAS_07755, partial [Planctomycetota bacterium]
SKLTTSRSNNWDWLSRQVIGGSGAAVAGAVSWVCDHARTGQRGARAQTKADTPALLGELPK